MEGVETRKVVKVGAKSLAISIPKKWAKSIGLEPGATVDLILNKDGSITIRPRKPSMESEVINMIRIDASNHSIEELMKIIEGCYIDGYDTIVLENIKSPEELSVALSNLSLKLPGMIVFSEGETVTIKIALSDNVIGFEEVLQRMVNVMKNMFENFDRFLRTGNEEYAKKILLLDDELDRMYFLGLRLVNRKPTSSTDIYREFKEYIDLSFMLKFVEGVGDCLDRSARVLMSQPKLLEEYRELLIRLYLTAMKLSIEAVTIYNTANVRNITKLLKRKSEYIWEVRKLREELAQKASAIIGVLVELEIIADLVTDLMERASARYIRKIR